MACAAASAARLQPGQRVLDAPPARSRFGGRGCRKGWSGRDRCRPGCQYRGREPGPLEGAHIVYGATAGQHMPFPDASFDAVISQFGLMFFEDRCQSVLEMVCVLCPGGRLAVAVWDSLEKHAGLCCHDRSAVQAFRRSSCSCNAGSICAWRSTGLPHDLSGCGIG